MFSFLRKLFQLAEPKPVSAPQAKIDGLPPFIQFRVKGAVRSDKIRDLAQKIEDITNSTTYAGHVEVKQCISHALVSFYVIVDEKTIQDLLDTLNNTYETSYKIDLVKPVLADTADRYAKYLSKQVIPAPPD